MRPKKISLEASKPAKARSVTSTGTTTLDVANTPGSADGPASGTRSQSHTQQDVFIDATVEPEEEL
ncbi:hypothetical protein N7G274_006425 [Stereocaulon virgatum]|uniref:Uncharacterized protein n=1 Tax=Stereocaulon virgatum TaxID=373712 RepID=A0ABR4A973_9LECA